MGGNAFPGKTRRYSATEYFTLVSEVLDIIKPHVDHAADIPAYRSKESFGDLDLLVIPKPNFNPKSIFNTDLAISNGGVHSVVYKEFQIDLIVTNREEFDYSLRYFSFNDRGNLIGKIAHKFGLKHGHRGLTMPIRDGDYLLGEVIVTHDPQVAEEFLGIEYLTEFNTLEEIFENVIKSRYFSKEIYAFENMNHIARIRDRKRSTYNAFLKYIEERDDLPVYEFKKVKNEYHHMIFEQYPHARAEYEALVAARDLRVRVREKFNGERVTMLTGLRDKELGALMRQLKSILTHEVVDRMEQSEVDAVVMKHYLENSNGS